MTAALRRWVLEKADTRTGRIVTQVSISYVARAASMLLNLLWVRLALTYCGANSFGAYITVASLTAFLTLSESGVGAGLQNKLTEAIARRRYRYSQVLVSSAYMHLALLLTVVCIITLVGASLVSWGTFLNLGSSLDPKHLNVTIAVGVVGALLALFTGTVNQVAAARNMTSAPAISAALAAGVSCLLLMLVRQPVIGGRWDPLLALTTTVAAASVCANVAVSSYVFATTPWLFPRLRMSRLSAAKDIFKFGGRVFVINIAVYFTFTVGNLVVAKISGPTAVAEVAVANRLFSILQTVFATLVFSSLTSMIQARVAGDLGWMRRSVTRLIYCAAAMSIVAFAVAALAPVLVKTWVGPTCLITPGIVWMQCAIAILSFWNNIFATALIAMAQLKRSVQCAVLGVVVNIAFAVPLGKHFGPSGVLLATALALIPSAVVLPRAFLSTLRIQQFLRAGMEAQRAPVCVGVSE